MDKDITLIFIMMFFILSLLVMSSYNQQRILNEFETCEGSCSEQRICKNNLNEDKGIFKFSSEHMQEIYIDCLELAALEREAYGR